ncbi:MAG TPA: class II aldolase/adducin family protein [Longimicrobiales bacterium]|nr:class II aldolase/adducin family protein [Longimicrobiales bacterium]
MNEEARREALIQGCRWFAESAFSPGTSGNLSVRVPGGSAGAFLVTPAGVPWDAITADALVKVDGAAGPPPDSTPSSEWRLHAAIYHNRPEVGAIVHAHPRAATAVSCLRRPIPPFHYMVAQAGGAEIPCAPYATFGTQSLAESVAGALGATYRACLMANHGLVAVGADLNGALGHARAVEALADQYLAALAAGDPVLLDEAEIGRVLKQFAVYADHPATETPLTMADVPAPDGMQSGPLAVEAPRSSLWDDPAPSPKREPPLVLLAHGSREATWKDPLLDVAEQLGRRQRRAVRVAFLQFDRPDLPTLAAELRREGIDRIDLIPVFYAAGRHLNDDVPALVERLESEGTAVEVLDAPGELEEFGDVLLTLLGRIAAG